ARKAPGRNEAGDGLRGPKPDPAYPYGCEPFAEVSSLARCLTIRLLSNHSADIANSKIAVEWPVNREQSRLKIEWFVRTLTSCHDPSDWPYKRFAYRGP